MTTVSFGSIYGSLVLESGSVGLVTCVDGEGRPNIITCSAIFPVQPRFVSVAVAFTRYSHDLIKATGEYVINLPGSDLREAVAFCGSRSGRDFDKFKECGLTQAPARKVKVPMIQECIAWIECRVFSEGKTDDHTLFIGEVVEAYGREDSSERLFQPDQVLNKWALLDLYAKRESIKRSCRRSGADFESVLRFWRNYYTLFDPSTAQGLDE